MAKMAPTLHASASFDSFAMSTQPPGKKDVSSLLKSRLDAIRELPAAIFEDPAVGDGPPANWVVSAVGVLVLKVVRSASTKKNGASVMGTVPRALRESFARLPSMVPNGLDGVSVMWDGMSTEPIWVNLDDESVTVNTPEIDNCATQELMWPDDALGDAQKCGELAAAFIIELFSFEGSVANPSAARAAT